jgi:hypothetical protein
MSTYEKDRVVRNKLIASGDLPFSYFDLKIENTQSKTSDVISQRPPLEVATKQRK